VDDQRVIRILKALSDANRFRMVREIAAAGTLGCGQVGERFALGQPTVSHHLKVLADAGILVVRREGQHAIISVDSLLLDEVVALLPARLRSRPVAVRPAAKRRRR
jgi:ArsR family transcriptional regulator